MNLFFCIMIYLRIYYGLVLDKKVLVCLIVGCNNLKIL